MRCTTLPCAVRRLFTTVNHVLPPPRTTLGLAALWGADIAGTWLLDDKIQVVVNGIAVAASVAMLARWVERRAHARAQAAVFEANRERAALIKTIERLTGGTQTGPIRLRDVA